MVQLISADYYGGKPGQGTKAAPKKGKAKASGGGRKVASEAGAKRYGLPIGTPLGQTKSKAKGSAETQRAYATFEQAKTPADLRKAASWMGNDDLGRMAEALFSFTSSNERDEAARMALVRELADRGIDPARYGYRGGPVQLNPNPKQDPVVKAAEAAQRKAEAAAAKAEREKKAAQAKIDKAKREAEVAARKAEADAKKARERADEEIERELRNQAGDAISQGLVDEKTMRDQFAERRRQQAAGRAARAG